MDIGSGACERGGEQLALEGWYPLQVVVVVGNVQPDSKSLAFGRFLHLVSDERGFRAGGECGAVVVAEASCNYC